MDYTNLHKCLFSEEFFGFGKKKEPPKINITLDEIHKHPKYNKELFNKIFGIVKNAWNWKAYKLPSDIGAKGVYDWVEQRYTDEEIEEFKKNCGFEDKIKEFEKFGISDHISNDGYNKLPSYTFFIDGIYQFAYGQPIEFKLYDDVMDDISERWEKRLVEKIEIVDKMLNQHFTNFKCLCYVGTGDGDEGCVYPTFYIDIPLSEFTN